MSDDIDPLDYLGSTAGNAYFSGIGFDMMFEAICVTHDERDKMLCPQTRVTMDDFKAVDDNVSAAIAGKEFLDRIVEKHGNR